jgi:hypothetical protein
MTLCNKKDLTSERRERIEKGLTSVDSEIELTQKAKADFAQKKLIMNKTN